MSTKELERGLSPEDDRAADRAARAALYQACCLCGSWHRGAGDKVLMFAFSGPDVNEAALAGLVEASPSGAWQGVVVCRDCLTPPGAEAEVELAAEAKLRERLAAAQEATARQAASPPAARDERRPPPRPKGWAGLADCLPPAVMNAARTAVAPKLAVMTEKELRRLARELARTPTPTPGRRRGARPVGRGRGNVGKPQRRLTMSETQTLSPERIAEINEDYLKREGLRLTEALARLRDKLLTAEENVPTPLKFATAAPADLAAIVRHFDLARREVDALEGEAERSAKADLLSRFEAELAAWREKCRLGMEASKDPPPRPERTPEQKVYNAALDYAERAVDAIGRVGEGYSSARTAAEMEGRFARNRYYERLRRLVGAASGLTLAEETAALERLGAEAVAEHHRLDAARREQIGRPRRLTTLEDFQGLEKDYYTGKQTVEEVRP